MKENCKGDRILFVGLNTVDLQFLVNEFPMRNTKTKAKKNEIFAGGPATNAAIACAHLGAKVDLLTPIGKHTLSAFIQEEIEKYGIRILDPIAGEKAEPIFASIITSENNGERTIFSYHPDSKGLYNIYENLNLKEYQLVLFDGFYPELALKLAKNCKKSNIKTVLDGGSWKKGLADLLKYIDVAICSNDFKISGCETAHEIMDFLHEHGIDYTAITRGEHSIHYSHTNIRNEIDVEGVEVVDTLGAGDFFHGAFCYYLSKGEDFSTSLKLAAKVAGESCKSFGTRAWMNHN